MVSSPLTEYVSGGSKKVSGWFDRIDAEMFQSILEHQNQKSFAEQSRKSVFIMVDLSSPCASLFSKVKKVTPWTFLMRKI
jgi:hypothetical protein